MTGRCSPGEGLDLCLKPWLTCGYSATMMGPIVGDGTELAAIRQRNRQLAVDDSVAFAGRFPTRRCGNS